MQRISCAAIAAFLLVLIAAGTAESMPIQPVTVTLRDVPNTNQVRGSVSFQGLPSGVAVQVSLKAAGPGPDAAVIGRGSCTNYHIEYRLKPIVDGLSQTRIAGATVDALIASPHVVIAPALRYCAEIRRPPRG